MLPILFAVVFGIIDFGNSFNDWISVRQGARDGLRQVIVKTTPTASACLVGSGSGLSGDGLTMTCYTKDRVGLDAKRTAVKILFSGSFTAGQPVKVCVQYKTYSLSGFYPMLNNRVLDTQAESLIEQTSATFTTPVSENTYNFDGSPVDWSSCSSL